MMALATPEVKPIQFDLLTNQGYLATLSEDFESYQEKNIQLVEVLEKIGVLRDKVMSEDLPDCEPVWFFEEVSGVLEGVGVEVLRGGYYGKEIISN